MHVCASVKVFIKQLGLRLAVARRRARQLQMAEKDTSHSAGRKQTGAAVGKYFLCHGAELLLNGYNIRSENKTPIEKVFVWVH